jgi:class 3 adenylate cyclase
MDPHQEKIMKQYSGAVLFIDMLGIGALTRGSIPLRESEYIPWNVAAAEVGRHHVLGAKLLMQFRRSLLHTQKTWPAVKVAQLSDCAFLWSPDPISIINAAREVMWHVTRAGLLCRAGLAYGQIVEPDKVNKSLGQFVLGDAVTRAVGFEGSGKGARVFCDENIAHEVLKRYHFRHEPFAPLKNPLDGSVIDEFRWYMLPNPIENHNYKTQAPIPAALALVELLTTLRYSPRLNWNSLSVEGRLQVDSNLRTQ